MINAFGMAGLPALAGCALFAISDGSEVWRNHGLISALLILVFGMALGVGMICFLLVVHFMRTGKLANRNVLHGRESFRDRRTFGPIFLPGRWLAIRSTQLQAVQSALRLHKPRPCSWEEGLTVSHDVKLFISPPIAGWTLVMGTSLPDPADDVDRCFHFLLDLSRKLGHVQFFSLNRVLNHHAWVQAEQGQILRAYAWAGRTLWNQGRPTRAELELGMTILDYGEQPATAVAYADPGGSNTDRVPLLAARWSFDPAAIDVRRLKESHGIAGELSRRKTV
jgi:hypothetical protein